MNTEGVTMNTEGVTMNTEGVTMNTVMMLCNAIEHACRGDYPATRKITDKLMQDAAGHEQQPAYDADLITAVLGRHPTGLPREQAVEIAVCTVLNLKKDSADLKQYTSHPTNLLIKLINDQCRTNASTLPGAIHEALNIVADLRKRLDAAQEALNSSDDDED